MLVRSRSRRLVRYTYLRHSEGANVVGKQGSTGGVYAVKSGKTLIIGTSETPMDFQKCLEACTKLASYLVGMQF